MSKAEIFVTGNLTDAPRLNRTHNGTPVANFRIASTKRRFDQSTQTWVDANTLYVSVECFGDLGAHVVRSLVKGDAVVVSGDLYSSEWESEAGKRTDVRVKADSVGPDLTRGWTAFTKAPRATAGEPAPAPVPDDLGDLTPGYDLESDGERAGEAALAGAAPF